MSPFTRSTKLMQAKGEYFVKVFFNIFLEVLFTSYERRRR
jgi:hypothetical protein